MIDEIIYAAATLIVWSALYRDNPFFKFAQRLIVGLYLGMTITSGLDVLYTKSYIPIFEEGKFFSLVMVGTILGILSLARLVKGGEWISRYPLSVLAGIGGSVALTGAMGAQILGQLQIGALTTLDGILMAVGTFTTLTFFLFAVKSKSPILKLSVNIGKIFLMVALGCMLGLEFMTNVSLPIGSMPHLVKGPGVYVSAVALVILAVDILSHQRKSK